MTQDDLTPWQDTPLVKALTGEGTAAELAGKDAALSAFQASWPARRRRRVLRFLGAGATSVALVGAIGGGVAAAAAAAYTRSLPDSVQSFAHDVFAPIGVPAPHHHKGKRPGQPAVAASTPPITSTSPKPTPSTTATASTTPQPSPSGTNRVGGVPVGSASPSITPSLSASPTPTPTPTETATPSPSPTGPAGDPSTWSMTATVSSQVVRVHDGVRISGTLLDAAGQPVADHRVVLRVHEAGASGWTRAGVRLTDSEGMVQTGLGELTRNTAFVLGAGHHVSSSPLRIVVRPVLSASVTPAADGTSYVVTVTADGGDAGDLINLLKHTASGWEQIGQAQLDDSASASFSVPAPKRKHGYLIRLPATKLHGEDAVRVVLNPLN